LSDRDLLQPTLDESYDEPKFQSPWRPWHLIWVAIFGGLVAAAIVYPWNYRRLGQPRHAEWALAVLVPLAVVVPVLSMWYLVHEFGLDGAADVADLAPEDRRSVRLFQRAVTFIPAAIFSSLQDKRYRLYEANGGEPGRLLGVALALIFGSLVVSTAVVGLVLFALGEFS